jgi:hypothetical protein
MNSIETGTESYENIGSLQSGPIDPYFLETRSTINPIEFSEEVDSNTHPFFTYSPIAMIARNINSANIIPIEHDKTEVEFQPQLTNNPELDLTILTPKELQQFLDEQKRNSLNELN